MKDKHFLSKQWCDLAFKDRNTEYGAYLIRKQTGRRYAMAFGCLGFMGLLVAIPFIIIIISTHIRIEPKDIGEELPRFEGVKIKEARPMRRPPKKSAPVTSDNATPDIIDIEPDEDLLTAKYEDEEVDPEKIVELPKDSLQVLLEEQHLELAKQEERTEGVIIDEVAKYPGGISMFKKWLESVVVYPKPCISRKQSGTVIVSFIVNTDGSTSDARIVQPSDRLFNNEALRAMQIMHKQSRWIPATRNGKPIKSQVTIPIAFVYDNLYTE